MPHTTTDRAAWIWANRKDPAIIPQLSDAELVNVRLLADIRADHNMITPATAECLRRRIRDYPIAI